MSSASKSTPALPVVNGRADTSACWSCGDMRAAHFCEACGRLQPAGPTDYFSFFGLPRTLNLDAAALEQEFYRLSRKLHPDLYVIATDQERDWSLEKSSQLNAAYRTLKDPIARTEYLLRLEGLHFDEQSKRATEAARHTGGPKQQIVPPSLLEEVFDVNLQLEEFRLNRKLDQDDSQLLRDLGAARQRLERKHQELAAELQRYWDAWDALLAHETPAEPAPGRRALCAQMLDLLNRRTYIRNLLRDVNEALES
jgi:molecular chaperone HscB